MGWGCWPHTQPPTWRSKGFSVRVLLPLATGSGYLEAPDARGPMPHWGFKGLRKKERKERLALITASNYRGSAAQRGRTRSIYRCPWLPLYGPCMTSEHSLEEGGKPEYPEKNPRSQIEIDKSPPTCGPRESIPGRRGGKRE